MMTETWAACSDETVLMGYLRLLNLLAEGAERRDLAWSIDFYLPSPTLWKMRNAYIPYNRI